MEKVNVKVLWCEGKCALVEWSADGDLYRASVLQSAVHNDQVSQSDLDAAIKFGVAWNELEFPPLAGLSYELHRRGIWTHEDARQHSEKVRAAVIAATRSIVETIVGGSNK